MSAPELSPDELLAAELALGLLEGEALLAARSRRSADAAFAAQVDWWNVHLAPLLDEVPGAVPTAGLGDRIAAAIRSAAPGEAEVAQLRRRLRLWQGTTGLALVASVAALAFAFTPALRQPIETGAGGGDARGAPLFASIPIADTPLRLAVTWLPDRRELLIGAPGLTSDGVHDHELWLVRDGGAPVSLGVVKPGATLRTALAAQIAAQMHAGARMVLTREPLGGKPPALPAGPIVAEGQFIAT